MANGINNHSAKGLLFALIALTTLFFMWGFLTTLNSALMPLLQDMFALNDFQKTLVASAFFGAYAAVSIPASKLVGKIGYQKGLVLGLGVAGLGCLAFYPAAQLGLYPVFLAALFVLAAGVTVLQVAANPYVNVLGPAESAASRLNTTSGFNALGMTLAPMFGAYVLLSDEAKAAAASNAELVSGPYLGLALTLLALAVLFFVLKLPKIGSDSSNENEIVQERVRDHRHLVLGALGIFLYVGVEVCMLSFIPAFAQLDNIGNMSADDAQFYISLFFLGIMIGRFAGAIIMKFIRAGLVLAATAITGIALISVGMIFEGTTALYAMVATGFCASIMFPTIFSLALQDLGALTSKGSGIICVAIVGGAVLPPLQGLISDSFGLQVSFIVPLLALIFVAYYGLVGYKPRAK